MSLHKIRERLLAMGLLESEADEIVDMVRQFGLDVLRTHAAPYLHQRGDV